MITILTKPTVSDTVRVKRPIITAEAKEFIVVCSRCGTIETIWVSADGLLVPTQKFNQYGGHLYHDCGADAACQLYRIS